MSFLTSSVILLEAARWTHWSYRDRHGQQHYSGAIECSLGTKGSITPSKARSVDIRHGGCMFSGRLSKIDPTISMLQQKSRHSRLRKRFPVVYHPILVTLFEFHLNYCCLPFSWKQSGHSPLTSKRHFHPANCCSLDIFLSKSWR